MKPLLFFCSILWGCAGFAQNARQPLTVNYAGLGAYSRNFVDVFSGTANQASLAQLKTGAFGAYGERRFMLQELSSYRAVFAVPTSSGTIGLQGDYFGSTAFNETQLGLLYARKITAQIDAGVKFNYHNLRTPGYGSGSAVNFEAGAIIHLTEKLHSGFHVYNPTSSKLGKTGNEKLASVYTLGLGYEASDKVFVGGEIVKQEDAPVSVRAGIHYNVDKKVFLRAGISTLNNNSYASIGFLLGIARVDVNAAYHPQLGFTPGVLLLVNLKKAEK